MSMIVAALSSSLAFSRGLRPIIQPLHLSRSAVAVDGGLPPCDTATIGTNLRHAPVQLYLADDPMGYAFMLPTAVAVATSCQLCGIGGAALFSPIFLLAFPLLGPEYPLDSPAAAIASALLTEVFGFSSGLSGYARRGLVAWPVALQFAAVAVPLAFGGALCAGTVASYPGLLRIVYAALMLGLAVGALPLPRDQRPTLPMPPHQPTHPRPHHAYLALYTTSHATHHANAPGVPRALAAARRTRGARR